MGLFKEVKKPVIKGGGSGADISGTRPHFVEKTPPCISTCPCGTDIRGWLTAIAQSEEYGRSHEQSYEMAWHKITEHNPFPAVCGRVCPHPCEDGCNRNVREGGVAINALERYVGDFGLSKALKLTKLTDEVHSEKVAVIGAGPAGLSCAYQLARRGYGVTVFEAFNHPGGMLRYGIPCYRLPREVLDAEIQNILDVGVELHCNTQVGRDISVEQLRKDYAAVFVGIGAHKGARLGVPGEDAPNVYTGTEFLNRANSGQTVDLGGTVIVVGGGDTAIDAARMSKRLGASVTIFYRRTRQEMPAIKPEIEGALEEGVQIDFLVAPVDVLVKDGKAVGLKCIRMELGEPDASGRRRPLPIAGSEFEAEATAIITAISQEPEWNGLVGIQPDKNWVNAGEWGETGVDGIFAGGDDTGLALVTTAISQGQFAATAIDARLRGKTLERPLRFPAVKPEKMKPGWYKEMARHARAQIPVPEREKDTEIELGLSEAEVFEEARRCMSCGACMDCETCWMLCSNSCFVKQPKGEHFKIKLELCNGCQKCAQECPCGYIEMQ